MMRIRILLCFCFLCLTLGCENNVQRTTENSLEQSITLITLGIADSATKENNGHGIMRCLYIDISNERFILYTKFPESGSVNYFKRSQTSGSIKGIKKSSAARHYLKNIKALPNGNLIPNYTDGALHCGPTRLTIIKAGNIEKGFATDGDQYAFELFNEVETLRELPINKKSISTRITLNEDSILVPVLTHTEFSTLHKGIPLATPPPIRNDIKFFPSPSKN